MSTWRCVALSGGVALVCGEAWQDLLWRDLLWQCGRHGSRCLLRGPFFLFFSFLFFPPPALTPFGIQGPSSGSTKFTGPSCGHPNQPTYERAFEDSMLWADRCTFSGEPGSNGMASTLPTTTFLTYTVSTYCLGMRSHAAPGYSRTAHPRTTESLLARSRKPWI